MSLPALDDITAHRGTVDPIDGVLRVETAPREKATPIIMEMMRSVYPHDEVFGTYCTVNDYIDCPPDELFDYLADPARGGATLREADVAQDVFGRGLDLSGDASVRVYVHRLRKKLDDFYARPGAPEPHRLVIPVGEYRLDVVDADVVATPVAAAKQRPRWLWPAVAAALVLVAANAGAWWWVAREAAPSR